MSRATRVYPAKGVPKAAWFCREHMDRRLPQTCRVCRKLKDAELGSFRKKRGTAHGWYFVCHACETPVALPGRDRAPTPLERSVTEALLAAGYPFQREFQVGPFWFDFAVPALRLLIEADSTRYHRWPSQVRRDKAKDRLAAETAWKLVRVSQPDVQGKVQAALDHRAVEVLPDDVVDR